MAADHLTRLLLVRHGESLASVERIVAGQRSCQGLSDLGRRQVAALRERLAAGSASSVDALFASTLPRAIETAEILQPALGGLPLTTLADLQEQRPGAADGVPFDSFVESFGPPQFGNRPHLPLAPEGESHLDFFFRTERALHRIVSDHRGQTVLIACHGGVIDIAFRSFLDIPRRGHFDLWTLNASVTELAVDDRDPERGRWRLVRYNDSAHLAGLPAATRRG